MLRVNPYGESKVMLSILFKEVGKKSLSGSKKLGLDMGDSANFEVTKSKGKEIITGITALSSPLSIRRSYPSLILLSSICEICERATKESEDLYDVLMLGKAALAEASGLKELFRAYTLTLSGLGVNLGISNPIQVPTKSALLNLLDIFEQFIGKQLHSRSNVEALLDDLEKKTES